jgi:hypothetical protein
MLFLYLQFNGDNAVIGLFSYILRHEVLRNLDSSYNIKGADMGNKCHCVLVKSRSARTIYLARGGRILVQEKSGEATTWKAVIAFRKRY